jgi:hypothetical protein
MHNLESDLHVILDDIALDIHSFEEQAKIIAYASSILSKRFNQVRLAKTDSKTIEANMTEAILVAMKSLTSWDDDDDETEIVDGRGLSVSQLVRKVANTKPSWGKMDILDPDVLEDVFSYDEETSEEPENVFENAQQTTEAFDTPGRGRHRSDFTKK